MGKKKGKAAADPPPDEAEAEADAEAEAGSAVLPSAVAEPAAKEVDAGSDEETEKKKKKKKKKEEKEEEEREGKEDDDDGEADFGKKKKGKKKSKKDAEVEEEAKEEAEVDADAEDGGTREAEAGEEEEDGDDGDDEPAAKVAEAAAPAAPREIKPFSLPFRPHTDYPEITRAEEVVYCPFDDLPPDFCRYGPCWEKSKPWVLENFPHYYPEFADASIEDAKKGAAEANERSKVKELPGGKKIREASPKVQIKRLQRGGRKAITVVVGLEGFGVKLDAAAKLFKKKFACGSAVVKGSAGVPDAVEIQGDVEAEVEELITDEYKVPEDKIVQLEGGTKKGGKKK